MTPRISSLRRWAYVHLWHVWFMCHTHIYNKTLIVALTTVLHCDNNRPNNTVAHYVAIHCPRDSRAIGHAVQHDRYTTASISALGLHPVARKLLLISRPAEGRRLSWPEHTVG